MNTPPQEREIALKKEFNEKFDQYAFEFPRIQGEVADFWLAKNRTTTLALLNQIKWEIEKKIKFSMNTGGSINGYEVLSTLTTAIKGIEEQ